MMSELSPSDRADFQPASILQGGQSVPSTSPPLDPDDLPPPIDYLTRLAHGQQPAEAQRRSGITERGLGIARQSPDFSEVERILRDSLAGGRPEIARQLLAHASLSSALGLVREAATAPHARDRIHAHVAILDHGPLAPRQEQSQGAPVVQIQIAVLPGARDQAQEPGA